MSRKITVRIDEDTLRALDRAYTSWLFKSRSEYVRHLIRQNVRLARTPQHPTPEDLKDIRSRFLAVARAEQSKPSRMDWGSVKEIEMAFHDLLLVVQGLAQWWKVDQIAVLLDGLRRRNLPPISVHWRLKIAGVALHEAARGGLLDDLDILVSYVADSGVIEGKWTCADPEDHIRVRRKAVEVLYWAVDDSDSLVASAGKHLVEVLRVVRGGDLIASQIQWLFSRRLHGRVRQEVRQRLRGMLRRERDPARRVMLRIVHDGT